MKIETLSLENYRNIAHLKIELSPALNIFYGDNAQGKSNLLESMYLLAYSKSFRTSLLSNVTRHGFEISRVEGNVNSNEVRKELVLLLNSGNKQLYVDKKLTELRYYLGNLHVVLYVPFDLLIYGLPRERRRYLDRAIVSLDKNYLHAIANYNKVLKMRNALFKRKFSVREMESWNEQFIQYAIMIWKARAGYVQRLCQEMAKKKCIFFQREHEIEIGLKTEPQLPEDLQRWEDGVRYCLEMKKEKEKQVGYTLIGPHRDDLVIMLNNYDMKHFGSSGQLKAIVIMLTLSQLDLYQEENGEYPVLICDDIDTELDSSKISSFLSFLSQEVQVFLSTTQRSLGSSLSNAALYEIKEGKASRQ